MKYRAIKLNLSRDKIELSYRAIKNNLSRDILPLSRDKIKCGMSSMGHGTNARVTVATSDVQSILEIPVTDEIHMEDLD